MNEAMTESEYRAKIQATMDRIGNAFENIDPDLAECEQALGSMSITLRDGSRCILSAQPSVRQLWLALAAKGLAFHFNYDSAGDRWVDDKGRGIEVLEYLRKYFQESVGIALKF